MRTVSLKESLPSKDEPWSMKAVSAPGASGRARLAPCLRYLGLLAHAPEDWTRDSTEDRRREKQGLPPSEAPENLWIHPKALGGIMLGVSRTGYAWSWSGRPEWARAGSAR